MWSSDAAPKGSGKRLMQITLFFARSKSGIRRAGTPKTVRAADCVLSMARRDSGGQQCASYALAHPRADQTST
jgi:hypothetical protein